MSRISNEHIQKVTKYLVVGVSAVIIDNGTFYALFSILKVPLFIATISSLIVGLIVSFMGNKIWVFSAHSGNAEHTHKKQILLYGLLFAINTAFTYLFIRLVISKGMHPSLGKLIATAIITLWNYMLYRKVIFRLKAEESDHRATTVDNK